MNDRTVMVDARVTGEWLTSGYTGNRCAPTHEEIARLAFHLYESRGRQEGHALEDWLRAEKQLVYHYA